MINLNDVEIRNEQPSDYFETENLVREAFWNVYMPGAEAHYILNLMRRWPSFIAELDFVAVYEGRIVGSVVCNQSFIIGNHRIFCNTVGLGPLSVLPEFQRQGLGGLLLKHTQKVASELNFHAIILFGDPNYYSRYGFKPAESFGIRTYDNFYKATLQVYELQEGGAVDGRYFENSHYFPNPEQLKKYDSQFPPKETKIDTPTQLRYKELLKMSKPFED